jgi:WD40 repeat protein
VSRAGRFGFPGGADLGADRAAFAFSPDLQLCATVGEDGCLRIINAAEEKFIGFVSTVLSLPVKPTLLLLYRLLDTFAGYFGSLNCVAWSPDGRFVVVRSLPVVSDLC